MRVNRSLAAIVPALCLALSCLAGSAIASGGSGSGGSGGSSTDPTVTTLAMNTGALPLFNGMAPAGQATFSYSKDGATKSLEIQLENVNLPDGDTVDVEVDEAVRVSNWISHNYLYVPMTIHQGAGTLIWSTANGDAVPFLLPTIGTTTITVWGNYTVWPGTMEIATGIPVVNVAFGALTRG
jgi:hypothetical protein